jgi:hypothetical protein
MLTTRRRCAERRDDAHCQHEQREGHDRVDGAADDAVSPAAIIAGGKLEQGAVAEIEAGGTMMRDRMSRPSWSVPNQCAYLETR